MGSKIIKNIKYSGGENLKKEREGANKDPFVRGG